MGVGGGLVSSRPVGGDEWQEAYEPQTLATLFALIAPRDEEASMLFVTWPARVPIFVAVSVTIVSADLIDGWRDEGFLPVSYDADHLGAGVEWRARRTTQIEGRDVPLARLRYSFSDGNQALVVDVPESFESFVSVMAPDLALFLDSLEMKRADGSAFTAVASEMFGAADPWRTDV